ncbi:glycoside hydrolase family 26 protein [Streptomyces sp. NBC_00267]|uniref:glycoside hydrolase family 26 protein n=1 Tax=unclassified Streptomyces TaxID=2593676 RepID=UPI003FA69CAE
MLLPVFRPFRAVSGSPGVRRGLRPPRSALAPLLAALVLLAGPASVTVGEQTRAGVSGVSEDKGAGPAPPGPFGAYVGYGPVGIQRIAEIDRWLGPATPRVGHAYLAGTRWGYIEGAAGDLEHWAKWRRARADRLFVLNVPMLDRAEAHLPDSDVRSELRKGADGAYDEHFRKLARRLVSLRVPDTVLVVGWEMNGITYTHRCGPDPAAWKAYWVRIVKVMRSVGGQRFRFEFAPNRGRDAIPWTECYPGDRYVDVVGMDAYDQPHGMSFEEQVGEPYGLAAHVRFARAHGKPFSYPEWGLFRNGDNPKYVRSMLTWFAQHRPLYQTISDYCPHGVWRCPDNPRSSAVYRSLVGGPFG